MKQILLSVLLALCYALASMATTIVVPEGDDIQTALDQTVEGDTVLVSYPMGTYTVELNFPEHDIVLLGNSDITLNGAIYSMSGSTSATVIQGFTLREMYMRFAGGGATLQNIECYENPPIFKGSSSQLVARDSRFEDCANGVFFPYANASNSWGSLAVDNCKFVDNGLSGPPTVMLDENGEEILLPSERDLNFGAVVYAPLGAGHLSFTNNLCLSNEVNYIGNLVYAGSAANEDSVTVDFRHNTVVGQRSYYSDTATLLFAAPGSKNRFEVHNNIFADNGANCFSGNMHFSHNGVWPNDHGIPNSTLNGDPFFCDPAAEDYRLSDESPCLSQNNSWGELLGAYGAGNCAGVDVTPSQKPSNFELTAYPNPFNPSTTISFSLPVASHVKLTVYNLSGDTVATLADAAMPAGQNEVDFDASSLSSGTYIYILTAGDLVTTGKIMLVK